MERMAGHGTSRNGISINPQINIQKAKFTEIDKNNGKVLFLAGVNGYDCFDLWEEELLLLSIY